MGLLLLALGTGARSEAETKREFTADRHLARGLACEHCHGEREKKPVTQAQCLQCHSSYAAVAKRTRQLDPNPHASHQGEIECRECHKGHKADELYCRHCHQE
ncbi:MAG: cytochrome c3 family protein [Acidobacteria bacterium]|nr:cytochrome c3 family protein [Acidobacteriota bacterium]